MGSEGDLCDFCGGELEPAMVNLELKRDGELIICEGLPALVCNQCGEEYFSAEVSTQIDNFLEHYQEKRPSRYITVPVYPAESVLS
jgi:HTH-type transcriptional regulator/antitoxin MqsA